jgi:23S rRNA (cytidine1920-2'-O)/16S rRNA (cytidine1409-2'-O)-methyltransferase
MKRLDQILLDRGFYTTRSRANDAIKRGCVSINGQKITKAGQKCTADAQITIADEANKYVSRAALKLIKGLEVTGFNPAGKTAIDIGASTGGFSQVLLEHDVAHIFAVDVGHDQLVDPIKNHPKVTAIEGLNIKDFNESHLEGKIVDFLVCDVSFISLTKALPQILPLASSGAKGIFLIKPQFEVGKENLNKNGIVKTPELAHLWADKIYQWLNDQTNWQATDLAPSPIAGSDGNLEFLLGGKKA